MLSHLPYMIEHHPRITAATLIVSIIFSGAVIWGFEADRVQREFWWVERDKAHLECRQSGGTYEYFGSQGYHCIMPKVSAN